MGRNGEKAWSRRDELKLVAMRGRNWTWDEIGERLGRSSMACEVRFQRVKYLLRVNLDIKQRHVKTLAEIHEARLTPLARKRQAESEARAAAAIAREQAELSRGLITSTYFGDPPPGWSALDRKRKVEHA